jgi:hypothetical protein
MHAKYKYCSRCRALCILNISQFHGFNHHSFMQTLEPNPAEQEQELLVESVLVVDVTHIFLSKASPGASYQLSLTFLLITIMVLCLFVH